MFSETLGNPGLDVLDVPAVAEVAHAAGLPLLVDSTFTTPYLMRPFDHGADLVFHSATKFLGGHGIAIGGVLVDGGTFDWDASGLFPTLTEPYEGFHDLVFTEEYGPAAFIMRARKEGARDFGACMSPTTAFHILQGVETLPLRMERHVANTRKVVEFLDRHDAVASVVYPELPDHPDHELAKKLLPRGCGAVFSFELQGGRDAGRTFIESLRVFSHLANVGDAKSLVIHPASTTHHRMDTEALARAGISEGTVRLSIGLEDIDDLLDDLGTCAAPLAAGRASERRRAEGSVVRFEVDGLPSYAYTGSRPLVAGQPAVVFIHGGGLDHSVWIHQSRYFAHHGFNAVALDLPGHGRSEGDPLGTIAGMAHWTMSAADALGIERLCVSPDTAWARWWRSKRPVCIRTAWTRRRSSDARCPWRSPAPCSTRRRRTPTPRST